MSNRKKHVPKKGGKGKESSEDMDSYSDSESEEGIYYENEEEYDEEDDESEELLTTFDKVLQQSKKRRQRDNDKVEEIEQQTKGHNKQSQSRKMYSASKAS